MDEIEIDKLRLRCVIGVTDPERLAKSDVVLDLKVGTDLRKVARSDSLADGWDYRSATKAVIALVEESEYRTVEALAEAVAHTIVVGFGATAVRVRVHKPGALRFTDSVGVAIRRGLADYPASDLTGADLEGSVAA
ncbi:dihydroneopterin aldolase [Streptosporangium saharense]|uniref:dihydroneopterin aldolase n=1 Tax=Streptosporangium saharense TaxID=1706840 RepID=A0A7W7QVJ5_9ACTN|nr:dihydroneopterin aldolase [Streptosporangium saharense]MBB4920568.1 FolB domain-containing protein [Streptosporangium saharense]